MSRALVVGVDAGATSTRCLVAGADGTVLGRGRAGGANSNSSGGQAAAALGAALDQALAGVDRAAVRVGVLGAAGSAGAGRARFRAAAEQAWSAAGLGGDVVTVTDVEVAFAAGTAEPDGVLLLSGTGALAARFSAGVLDRRADGYGWLLGDEGSAVWIGLRGLRAVLAALDGRGERTALTGPACHLLGVTPRANGEDTAQALLAAAFARPPAALGAFAPAVSSAADGGDPIATRIVEAAASRLLNTFDTVAGGSAHAGDEAGAGRRGTAGVSHPEEVVRAAGGGATSRGAMVVLAGGVLLNDGPVARAVRAGLRERTGKEPREARDGAAGAALLALGRLAGDSLRRAEAHARLTGIEPRRQ